MQRRRTKYQTGYLLFVCLFIMLGCVMLWSSHSPNCHWTLFAVAAILVKDLVGCVCYLFFVCFVRIKRNAPRSKWSQSTQPSHCPLVFDRGCECVLSVDTHRQPIFGMNRTTNDTIFPPLHPRMFRRSRTNYQSLTSFIVIRIVGWSGSQ